MFAQGQIAVQILLVDPPKRTQKIARGCPQAFDGVGMNLTDPIAVIIARPFFLAVTHRGVGTINVIIALPFIRVTGSFFLGGAVHVFLQRLAIGMLAHAQPALPPLPPDGTNDGRTIILIGPVPSSFVGVADRTDRGVCRLFSPAF